MDLYSFCLTLGAAGLFIMALVGVSHGYGSHGAHHMHGGHSHTGHGDHGHAAHPGQAGTTHTTAGHAIDHVVSLRSLLSPRIIFSLLVGLGAIGVATRSFLNEPLLFAAALAGGVAFERLVVNNLWNLVFRFESTPALTLESAVEDEARAVTNFDTNGCGLISVEVDGHLVQVLGTLSKSDRESGVRVRAGDHVRIEAVDADRNRCTVRLA
jgi:translation initiation factor IF-1